MVLQARTIAKNIIVISNQKSVTEIEKHKRIGDHSSIMMYESVVMGSSPFSDLVWADGCSLTENVAWSYFTKSEGSVSHSGYI